MDRVAETRPFCFGREVVSQGEEEKPQDLRRKMGVGGIRNFFEEGKRMPRRYEL
jgi:hypothetical protein